MFSTLFIIMPFFCRRQSKVWIKIACDYQTYFICQHWSDYVKNVFHIVQWNVLKINLYERHQYTK